ncbi:MAG: type II toxin-antitoxin system VapC family toxin [Thermoplasmata archaeon]
MGMIYVIDTSAIISRNLNLLSGDLIFPRSVVGEIKKGRLKYTMDSLWGLIKIEEPKEKFLKTVNECASLTGDIMNLSETDKDVLAIAYEYNGTIVSDDYSIQNVASALNIRYMNANLKGISKQIRWEFRCTGCKKIFNKPVKQCDVCGHTVKRYYDKEKSLVKKI